MNIKKLALLSFGLLAGILAVSLLLLHSVQGANVITPRQGGTGTSTSPTSGYLLIGNSAGLYDYIASSTLSSGGAGDVFKAGNNTFTGLNVFTATTTNATTTISRLTVESTTSTNFNGTSALFTRMVITNATSTNVNTTGLTFTNGSGTSITTTNAFFTLLVATNGVTINATTTNLSVSGALALPNDSVTDAMVVAGLTISGGTVDNSPIGATTPSTGIFTNASSTNFNSTGLSFTTGTGTNLTLTSITTTNFSATNFNPTNITATNVTTTNLNSTSQTGTNATITNVSSTNHNSTNFTGTNSTITNATTTNFNTTILTFTSGTGTNVTTTNLYVSGLSNLVTANFGSATTTNFAITSAAAAGCNSSSQALQTNSSGGVTCGTLSFGGGGTTTSINGIQGPTFNVLGTANQVIVASSSNNITLSLPQSIATNSAVQFGAVSSTNATTTNLMATNATTTNLSVSGALSLPSNSITDAMVVAGLTISGGTVDNSPIGNGTASTGIFTNATTTNLKVTTVTGGTWNGAIITEPYGGTNQSSYLLGDLLYASATNTLSKLAGNTSSLTLYLSQTGNGSLSGAPSWQPIPSQSVLSYYFYHTLSDTSTFKLQKATATTTQVALTTGSVADGQVLQNWITPVGTPNISTIPDGQYEFKIDAAQTVGVQFTQLIGEIWEVSATGVDIGMIGASATSTFLTGSQATYTLFFNRNTPYALQSTASRIVTRVRASVTGIGTAPSAVLYYGGAADSHIEIPGITVDASSFVPYTGATANLNLGTNNLTLAGLTFTTMTGTSATTTNFNTTGLSFSSGTGTSVTSTNVSFTSANGTSVTTTNANFTNLVVQNCTGCSGVPANLSVTSITTTNMFATTTLFINATTTGLSFATANGTSVTSTNAFFTLLQGTSASLTNATSTNLYSPGLSFLNASGSNITSTVSSYLNAIVMTGPLYSASTTVSGPTYTILTSDRFISVSTSQQSPALTFPTAASACKDGQYFQSITIFDRSGNSNHNNIVVSATSTDTINGQTSTYNIFDPYTKREFTSDCVSNWSAFQNLERGIIVHRDINLGITVGTSSIKLFTCPGTTTTICLIGSATAVLRQPMIGSGNYVISIGTTTPATATSTVGSQILANKNISSATGYTTIPYGLPTADKGTCFNATELYNCHISGGDSIYWGQVVNGSIGPGAIVTVDITLRNY